MKVYFSHGKESGPWGTKIKRLAAIAEDVGCVVDSIDYTNTMDPDLRVEHLLQVLAEEEGEFVLVGSSMGGYVSLVASEDVDPNALFLMAPALYIPGYKRQGYHSRCLHIEIVHGWSDDVIPPENSIRYAREADRALHMISGDHALNGSLEVVAGLFERFLRQVIAKTVAVSESAAKSEI
jgi:predicted alpha/beta-hydrolase family hydrolase